MENEKATYKSLLDELQQILTELEAEMVDVDEIAAKMKRARVLVANCRAKLRDIDGQVKEEKA